MNDNLQEDLVISKDSTGEDTKAAVRWFDKI